MMMAVVFMWFGQLPFNYLCQFGPNWFFRTSTQQITDNYNMILVNPANWAFRTWQAIHTGITVFCIYSWKVLSKKGIDGKPLYESPPYLPAGTYIFMFLNLFSNIWGLFLYDRDLLVPTTISMGLTSFFVHVAILFSVYNLWIYAAEMKRNGLENEVYNTIKYVQNALGVYSTWTCLAFLRCLSSSMSYFWGYTFDQSAVFCLSFKCCWLMTWLFCDNYYFEKYFRYLITPSFFMCVTTTAVIHLNYDPQYNCSSIMIINVCLAYAGALAKLYRVFIMQHPKNYIDEVEDYRKEQALKDE